MGNIPPIPYPSEAGQRHFNPDTCSTASPGSSPRSPPLLQQPTRSDCSAAQNSIGSSSDFTVRSITRPENPLPTVSDAAEPAVPSGHGPWDIADPPTELTPHTDWVPADAVFEADPSPEYSNEHSIPEVANESSAHVTFDDPVSVVVDEGANEPHPTSISSNASNSTVPPPDEEIYRLRQIEDPRGRDWEVLDLNKTSRARLYQYYISSVWKLRVLCDQGKVMTDLPIHSEEDYALLKMLTRTNWGSRWWTIMIDDLKCPECVTLLKARRKDPKVR
jgi:hypothetical protein